MIPVSTPLVRLYSEYMHTEYGGIDSECVLVSLFAEPVGQPLGYPRGAQADRPDRQAHRYRVHPRTCSGTLMPPN